MIFLINYAKFFEEKFCLMFSWFLTKHMQKPNLMQNDIIIKLTISEQFL